MRATPAIRATLTSLVVAFASMAAARTATADGGYAEAVVGLGIPIAEDDYENAVDESLKLGVRAGGGAGSTAVELALDVTPVASELDSAAVEVGVQRYRMLIGGRHRIRSGPATLFVRAGVGVDVVHYSASSTVLGIMFEASETDLGLAAEVGGGFTIPVGGKLYVGGHLAVPMAFHFDDDDPAVNDDADLEYTGIDVDVLFTIGTTR